MQFGVLVEVPRARACSLAGDGRVLGGVLFGVLVDAVYPAWAAGGGAALRD